MVFLDSSLDYVRDEVAALPNAIRRVSPVSFNEETRYLPESVTSLPGYIDFSVTPYLREILECFDVDSPVREVNLKKGVQIGFTTILESGLLYYLAHVKTRPIMLMTADQDLASARVENNILPMLNESGLAHIVQSSDVGNRRKTGKTKQHIQVEGGGYLVPFGARNADKMRSYSIAVMLKDEIDAWPDVVGKDGDPDSLSDGRLKGYWQNRKIFRGSTPLIAGISKIEKQFKRGDQRVYRVVCKKCNFPQPLRWEVINKETGEITGGFQWDYNDDGSLAVDSVRYVCRSCRAAHFEIEKERLLSEEHGAHWYPTSNPVEPGIRSYHLPAFYSPTQMSPWSVCVNQFLEAFDTKERKVIDVGKYQVFRNTILAEPFTIQGAKVTFRSVSGHRRAVYRRGEIPNEYAAKHSGSRILMLTMAVDVHDSNLAVAVIGWTRDARSYLIDYWRLRPEKNETAKCDELTCSVWTDLQKLIEKKNYTADDGCTYGIGLTLIDAGYANDTVIKFCADYSSGVYPILGRDRPANNQTIKEFAEFETQDGTIGFRVTVDHYKDRYAPVLRSTWNEELERLQGRYCFNAPVDTSDAELKELTVESRREKTDETKGVTVHYWHRPGRAANELWDLLVYSAAGVEMLAVDICRNQFRFETVVWADFWEWLESEEGFYTIGESNTETKDEG